jgi:predicted MFS family arabinose efflux permease
VLNSVLSALNAYKNAFARPINDRYDIVLLGGALGSLFSLLQAAAAPLIGRLSDRYGRRTALLSCMAGNLLSVALWLLATDFPTFLASRIVGGLSEGNVQIATEIAADISDEQSRSSTMALIGACFSIAFTIGPALGAALSSLSAAAANPYGAAAGVSLALVAVETLYLYAYLPETHPPAPNPLSSAQEERDATTKGEKGSAQRGAGVHGHLTLNFTHFIFLLFFSGLEFSVPFLTYDRFAYGPSQSGRLFAVVGVIASVLQGSVVRRVDPLSAVHAGIISCAASFFVLDHVHTELGLLSAAILLAITSATVVTGLKSLSSFEAAPDERGGKLGAHRSWGKLHPFRLPRRPPPRVPCLSLRPFCAEMFSDDSCVGQFGRGLGPVIFCSLYWWVGSQAAYRVGGVGMIGVSAFVLAALRRPARERPASNAVTPATTTNEIKNP